MDTGISRSNQEIFLEAVTILELVSMIDDHNPNIQQCAKQLYEAGISSEQVKRLVGLANATDRVSNILKWIRLQVGRDSDCKGWANARVGGDLITALSTLRSDAEKIVRNLRSRYGNNSVPEHYSHNVHLELCRWFLNYLLIDLSRLETEGK